MIAESRHSPLSYLRAKDIEPDWQTLYEAFAEPDSMLIAHIHEGEMNVDTGPGGVGYSMDWTTEYKVEVRFERRYQRGVGKTDIDPAGVSDAFDVPAMVTQTEWSVDPDDRVVNVVVVELAVRERFESSDKSATEPIYALGSEEPVDHIEIPDADFAGGIASAEWPTAEPPDQSTAQDDAVGFAGTSTWVTTGLDGEEVTLTQDGDAWVDEEGNRYHIETDGELSTSD